MRTKLVKTGNSRGVRIPKPLLEQAGLGEDVELEVVQSGIVVVSPDERNHRLNTFIVALAKSLAGLRAMFAD